jgi:xylose dehydrogenase (NAD/NADP)
MTAGMTTRWGFLGAGMIAGVLADAVRKADGASLQAVGARDPSRARALGPVSAYDDYTAVLADPDVDAVYVALANDQHLPWSVAAMRAGKPVLCEKPLALTVDEVDELTSVSAETGQSVVEASWYRWHPRIRLAQQRLSEIGPVRHVAAGFTFDGSLEGNYRLDPSRGGGAMYDVGCYAVSACLWAVGEGVPAEVAARSELGPTGVDLVTDAILTWDSGAQAEVRAGISRTGEGQWLVITGERGEIELRDAPYTSWTEEPTQLLVSDGRDTERISLPGTNPYVVMVEEVSAVFRGEPGWALALAESRDTAAVLDAARAAAAAGDSVRL